MKQKAFVINLKKRPDRLEKLMTEMARHSEIIEVKRIEAIDGSKLNLKKIRKRIHPWNFQNLNEKVLRGQVACALSHLKAWKEISKIKQSFGIVLEDDVVFVKNANLKKIFHLLSSCSFDIIFLNEDFRLSKKIKIFNNIFHFISQKEIQTFRQKSNWKTTEAYAITPKFAKKLYLKIKKQLGAIDAHMRSVIIADPKIKAFSLFKPICFQKGNDSNIQE